MFELYDKMTPAFEEFRQAEHIDPRIKGNVHKAMDHMETLDLDHKWIHRALHSLETHQRVHT